MSLRVGDADTPRVASGRHQRAQGVDVLDRLEPVNQVDQSIGLPMRSRVLALTAFDAARIFFGARRAFCEVLDHLTGVMVTWTMVPRSAAGSIRA